MKKPTKRKTTTAKKPAKRAAPSPFPRPGHAASASTSSSVVRSRAGESDAITMAEYGGLQAAFDYLNAKLFGGRLPDAFITYTRKAHSYGHFSEDRYSARDGQFKKPEISLNPDAFVDRTDEQIVGTLAHEMKHLEQCRFGKPASRGYHNKEWAASMKAIGLMPSNTGAVGGKETGQQMSHYIIPGGAYARAFADLAASGWRLNLQSTIHADGSKGPDTSKTKFTCPCCGWIIRGKPDTKMICKPCLVAQLSGMDWIDVNMAEELLTAFGHAEMVSGHDVTDAVASYDRQGAAE